MKLKRFLKAMATALGCSLFVACSDDPTEKIPVVKKQEADTLVVSDSSKHLDPHPVEPHNPYKHLEEIINSQIPISKQNTTLKSQGKEKMIYKAVDNPKDSLLLLKLGRKVDTGFVKKYEFYVNKKTQEISVYDSGEDRLIPLKEWTELQQGE